MMDRTTGRSRGFGFVRFSAPEAVEAVLSAPQVLEGQVVDCKRAQPAEQLPPPKNPRARGEKMPDLNTWALAMLSMPGFQPEMPVFPQFPLWGMPMDQAGLSWPLPHLGEPFSDLSNQPFSDLSNQPFSDLSNKS